MFEALHTGEKASWFEYINSLITTCLVDEMYTDEDMDDGNDEDLKVIDLFDKEDKDQENDDEDEEVELITEKCHSKVVKKYSNIMNTLLYQSCVK